MSPARARTTQCQRRRALETSIIPSLPALPLVICPWVAMQSQLRSSQLLDASCCLLSEKMGEERGGREGVRTGQRWSRNFSEASCLRCNRERSLLRTIVGTTMGPTTSCRQPERLPSTRETRRVLSIRLRHTRGLSRTAMRAAPRCSSPPGPLAVCCCLLRNLV